VDKSQIENIAAALSELEAEKQRRIDEKVEKGEAVRVLPVVVGLPDGVEAAKASAVAALRASGENREVIFGEPVLDADGNEVAPAIAVIMTGVPRTGRDQLPDDYVPWKPSGTPYIPPGPEAQRASPEYSLPPESEPRSFWVTVEPPSEKSCGTIVEGTWTIADGVIRVRDMEGRLFTDRLGPNDDPEHVARKLLREKHGKHSSFYDPIKYPASYH
jgi:hypothetical protein